MWGGRGGGGGQGVLTLNSYIVLSYIQGEIVCASLVIQQCWSCSPNVKRSTVMIGSGLQRGRKASFGTAFWFCVKESGLNSIF